MFGQDILHGKLYTAMVYYTKITKNLNYKNIVLILYMYNVHIYIDHVNSL